MQKLLFHIDFTKNVDLEKALLDKVWRLYYNYYIIIFHKKGKEGDYAENSEQPFFVIGAWGFYR